MDKGIFRSGIRDIMTRRKTIIEDEKIFVYETTIYTKQQLYIIKKHLNKSNWNT